VDTPKKVLVTCAVCNFVGHSGGIKGDCRYVMHVATREHITAVRVYLGLSGAPGRFSRSWR